MKRGGYGLGWDLAPGPIGSIVVSWIFPGLVAVTIVAGVGAAGLIVAQRKIWPAIV